MTLRKLIQTLLDVYDVEEEVRVMVGKFNEETENILIEKTLEIVSVCKHGIVVDSEELS